MKNSATEPIGVFDSGVGGISVLADLIQILPNEKYIYYGDSGNAPYGIKETEEVKVRSFEIAEFLIKKGIKILVVACNTATSAAVRELRQKLQISVIGMEPALKPAVEGASQGSIVVMATPVTLKEEKFANLIRQFEDHNDIIKLPCPGLVEIIESKGEEGAELEAYLRQLFDSIDLSKVSSIVLGCTHYIFIRDLLTKVVGESIKLVDGNYGTAKHVARTLQQMGLVNKQSAKNETEVRMYNSGFSNEMELGKELLKKRLQTLGFTGKVSFLDAPDTVAFKQEDDPPVMV
ncbi:glutamate racemase [Alkaliphilus hydrothermalis]|uniref:Glutamate racemase n=1 Tax=Alkaliphilus hydrothermalis TaxID=1482730 RepID=A0ABS2NT07_9FIRM|nr:glutamate racemase [Alkaliphilus hydrothermalis]MBM7616066.1 glutamate racemase [Alkaliphilus hydrothermalis]